MPERKCITSLAVLVLCFGVDAKAKPTGLKFTPAAPVVGSAFKVELIHDGTPSPIATCVWRVTQIHPEWGPGVTFTHANLNNGTEVKLPQEGTYTVSVLVTYSPIPSQPPKPPMAPTFLTKDVDIPAPNGLRHLEGWLESTPRGTANEMKYAILAAGQRCGTGLQEIAVERFTNQVLPLKEDLDERFPPDGKWSPTLPTRNFYQGGGVLYDWWMTNFAIGTPVDTVTWELDQELALKWVFVALDADFEATHHEITNPLPKISMELWVNGTTTWTQRPTWLNP